MEATSHIREYSVSWTLTLEFDGAEELQYWDNEYFKAVVRSVIESERKWDDRSGQCVLEFGDPVYRREFHPDYGPEIIITFVHRGLTLSPKQLWAYETWAQKVASSISARLSEALTLVGLGKRVVWDIRMNLSTPIMNPEREYRLASKAGDVVRMPCGTLAVIASSDIIAAGHVKRIFLRPIFCGIPRQLWLWLRNRLEFEDDGINRLVKVGEVPLP